MKAQISYTHSAPDEDLASLGLQRRHGRKPDSSASLGSAKKVTFSLFDRLAGHDGLQYIPVERTPNTNAPS
jgi:hypothetical protein